MRETPDQIRDRVLGELAALRPQIEAGVAANKPNAALALRIVQEIESKDAAWFLAREREELTPETDRSLVFGHYSAGELLRHMVKQEMGRAPRVSA